MTNQRILFVSSVNDTPWGAAEELWSRAALDLTAEGLAVFASYAGHSPPHRRILDLRNRGVEVWFRPIPYPLRKRAWRALIAPQKTPTTLEVERLIAARPPDFVVISDGAPFPPLDLLEMCVAKRLPFVIIVQCNQYFWWPADDLAERYRAALATALRCYFVSDANRRIAEKQIGCELAMQNLFAILSMSNLAHRRRGRLWDGMENCGSRASAGWIRREKARISCSRCWRARRGRHVIGDFIYMATARTEAAWNDWHSALGSPIESCSRAMWRMSKKSGR